MKKEIRICGFGGQGIVLAGVILGEAAVKAGYKAVQTQSYGPEARGGAARSEVVIASEGIDYPRVQSPDVTVALSQPGYDRYIGRYLASGAPGSGAGAGGSTPIGAAGASKGGGVSARPTSVSGGRVIVDANLVEAAGAEAQPFMKTAEEVGHKIVTNIVMLGYLCALLEIIPEEAMEAAVLAKVPRGTEDLNRRALAAGRALFQHQGSVS